MTRPSSRLSRLSGALLANVALAVSLTASVWLGLMYSSPTTRIGAGEVEASSDFFLGPGDIVTSFQALDESGLPVTVDFGGQQKPTLLYVIKPECEWCVRNEANFAALVRAMSQKWNIVVLSTDGIGALQFFSSARSGWGDRPVKTVHSIDSATKQRLRLFATPQTLLILPDGKVEAAWHGAYDSARASAIEAIIQSSLPGLSVAAPRKAKCVAKAGGEFSAGFVGLVDGERKRCGEDGEWKAMTSRAQ